MPKGKATGLIRPASSDDAALEDIAADVAQRAAASIRAKLGSAVQVGTKATPTDTVTSADLEIEQFILAALQEATPGASVLGEEGTAVKGTTDIGWIIDPIDGTVNFLYDLPVIAVSIAATRGDQVVAGAVADVLRKEIFAARLGHGATLNGHAITVSPITGMADALIATGFSYAAETRSEEAKVVSRILPAARDIRCFGSSALNLAWVACGRIDGYWESDVKPWDVAAGGLLANEAGAAVDLCSPSGDDHVLAAAPGVFHALRRLVYG